MLEHIPTLTSQKDDARLAQVITKEEVVEVINDLEPNKIPTPNDFNILVLILKEVNPSSFLRFREITLCNRLKSLLHKIISNNQMALWGK